MIHLLLGAVRGLLDELKERDRLEVELRSSLRREEVLESKVERLEARLDVVERLARAYQESDSEQRQKLRELEPQGVAS
jgi:hypothetical protein